MIFAATSKKNSRICQLICILESSSRKGNTLSKVGHRVPEAHNIVQETGHGASQTRRLDVVIRMVQRIRGGHIVVKRS